MFYTTARLYRSRAKYNTEADKNEKVQAKEKIRRKISQNLRSEERFGFSKTDAGKLFQTAEASED